MTGKQIRRIGSDTKQRLVMQIKPVFRGFVAVSRPYFEGLVLEHSWRSWDGTDGKSFIVWWGIRGLELHYAIQIISTGQIYGTSE